MKLTKEEHDTLIDFLEMNLTRLTLLKVWLQAGEPISKIFTQEMEAVEKGMLQAVCYQEVYYQAVYYQSVKGFESISHSCDRLKYYLDCGGFIRPEDPDNDQ